MKLKLFENYEETEFEDKIKDNVDVSLYREPMEYRGSYVKGGKVKWVMDLYTRKSGYETGIPKLTYLYLVLEIEDEDTEEIKEIEIEVKKEQLKWEQFEAEVETFPLYLREIEIEMNHTTDPEFWKYKLIIGGGEEE